MKFFRLNRDPDPADPAAAKGGGDPAAPVVPAADPIKPDVTPVATDPASSKATIPAVTEPAAAPDIKKYSFFETVPDEYKDKPYLKNIQNFDQLYKSLDGAQELIGKRPEIKGVPNAESTDEERATFYKAMGKPDTAEGYEFEEVKLPEGAKRNDELSKFTKELFHKADLTKEQAKIIQGGYENKIIEMSGAVDPEAASKEFDKMITDTFADRQDTVLKNGQLLLNESVPEALKPYVDALGNKELLILSAVLDGVREKYISEDIMPREGDGSGGGETVNELRDQARVLMVKPEYTSKAHKDHAKIAEEVKAIYDRIERIENLAQLK